MNLHLAQLTLVDEQLVQIELRWVLRHAVDRRLRAEVCLERAAREGSACARANIRREPVLSDRPTRPTGSRPLPAHDGRSVATDRNPGASAGKVGQVVAPRNPGGRSVATGSP